MKAGTVRAIAVSTRKRTAALPDVPTADEQGLKGYDANTNGGFLAPAGTPKAIVAKLNAEINAALKLPDVRTKLESGRHRDPGRNAAGVRRADQVRPRQVGQGRQGGGYSRGVGNEIQTFFVTDKRRASATV